uniref:Uncharacterized protein n=1 Tax=Arundo donax TaxID=35708 RepID=A0A0A9E2K6_ARUDO
MSPPQKIHSSQQPRRRCRLQESPGRSGDLNRGGGNPGGGFTWVRREIRGET